jgi:hypothetical protein
MFKATKSYVQRGSAAAMCGTRRVICAMAISIPRSSRSRDRTTPRLGRLLTKRHPSWTQRNVVATISHETWQ